MNRRRQIRTAVVIAALGGMFAAAGARATDPETPGDWLDRMAGAVRTTNYEGTVIHTRGEDTEVLKVARIVVDGVVHEKIVVQEGDGIEIIRVGNEVQCILPDQKSVRVMEWNDRSALFSSLPSSAIRFGSEYDVSIVRTERIAGRMSVLLAIRPHDDFRFGHRIWLDTDTGFPLQTRLIGAGGDPIEQVKFADIHFDGDMESRALAPSISTENFRWFTDPKHRILPDVQTAWTSTGLPAGFRAVSAHQEELPGSEQPVTHVLYSDGLANVSVFVEPAQDAKPAQRSQVGASNSFSVELDGYRVTAVGEVPAVTVEQIATSMRPGP